MPDSPISIEEKLNLLRAHQLFRNLADEDLSAFVAIGQEGFYAPGETLIEEGEEDEDGFYLLLKGDLEVLKYVPTEDGVKGERIATLGAGDTFGEMTLIDKEPRSASIRAASHCQVLIFRNEAFHGMRKFLPDVYATILLNLSKAISTKLRVMDSRFALTLFVENSS